MDAINDLMGFPRLRGKETMYLQPDAIMRSTVHAPGYPAINSTVSSPMSDTHGGYRNHYYVRGPGASLTATHIEFHEQGHAYFFPKFGGNMEVEINILQPAVQQRMFGRSWDEAFRSGMGSGNAFRTLGNIAVKWMTSFNFSPRNNPMATAEKAYQMKGYAMFIEIARLFGWDALGAYYRSFMEYGTEGGNDDKQLRLARHVGWDTRPLLHFWGTHPGNPAWLASQIAAEGIPPSADIYDLLVHYKSLGPDDNAAFRSFAYSLWGRVPSPSATWTQTEHARQWDQEDYYTDWGRTQVRADITVNEEYIEACAQQLRERVQEIIDLYFPDGRPGGELPPTMRVERDRSPIVNDSLDSVGGAGSPLIYRISNPGGLVLELETPVTIGGESNCSVTIDMQPAGTLSGGAGTDLVLTVTPAGEGAWGFTVSIANNDEDNDPYTWTVTGAASILGGQLGILDLTANDGINPATGEPWQHADSYRLVFISSTLVDPQVSAANDMAYWNDQVQAIANAATTWDLSGVAWRIIGSTGGEHGVDARDNTRTNPAAYGTGHAILHMDGSVIENNFVDLWNGEAPANMGGEILFDENGVDLALSSAVNWPLTGTNWDGTAHDTAFLKDATGSSGSHQIRQGHPTSGDGRGWVDAQRIGASWFTSSPASVYGMSERLFVIDRSDDVAPQLVSFANDVGDGPILFPKDRVVYTVTFDEAILPSSVTVDDFENARATGITIDDVRQLNDPAVFEVTVTPLSLGIIQLQVRQGAEINDLNGNPLDTGVALSDETIIVVEDETGPPTCTVTFDKNAEDAVDPEPASKAVTVGEAYGDLAETSRVGYIFLGWFTAAGGGAAVSSDTVVTRTVHHTLYAQWITVYDDWAGEEAAFGEDTSGDGTANGIAWVLGATDPTVDVRVARLLPTLGMEGDPGEEAAVFTFRRLRAAHEDPNTAIKVEYSIDLVDWIGAVDGEDGIVWDTEENGGDFEQVEIKFSWSLAQDDRLFVLLRVAVTRD